MLWLQNHGHPTPRRDAAGSNIFVSAGPKEVTGMHRSKRSLATVTAVLGALAIAAPIADAGAATTPGIYPGFSLPAFATVPAFYGGPLYRVPLSFAYPSVGGMAFAKGPTVINSVANGATVVQIVNGAAASSIIASP
jgi:hypothetical protein